MTDPVSDLLTRIRNALQARHESLTVPHSRLKLGIVKILSEEGFTGPHRVFEDEAGKRQIQIILRYAADKEPIISSLVRQSRPGRQVYLGFREIRPIRNGFGIAILSTPKGVLTDRQAREMKTGGQLLCTVW